MKRILIIDDEIGVRRSLKAVFEEDYQISLAADAESALSILERDIPDVILLDVMMPERDGLSLLTELQERYADIPVIMVSASTGVRPVVRAIQTGAFDYIAKPFDVEELRRLVEKALSKTLSPPASLPGVLHINGIRHELIGTSPVFSSTLEMIRQAAQTNSTVLFRGESGAGKELAARWLHTLSVQSKHPFIPVPCATLGDPAMEAELFGMEKDTSHNVGDSHMGLFDEVASGTIFFDEISELSLPIQAKLLRVLEEREYMRVGGAQMLQTHARIVASTAVDIEQAVEDGHFRRDLYYRLNVIPINMPPLRERRDDVHLLVNHFVKLFRTHMQVNVREVDRTSMDLLADYEWPGNVRELKNVIERMMVIHGQEETLLPKHLPSEFRAKPVSLELPEATTLETAVNEFERGLVEHALREADGVQTKAAQMLGTTRRILKYRMEKLNITPEKGELVHR